MKTKSIAIWAACVCRNSPVPCLAPRHWKIAGSRAPEWKLCWLAEFLPKRKSGVPVRCGTAKIELGLAATLNNALPLRACFTKLATFVPHPKISVEVEVRGINEEFQPQNGVLRLGGEGRFSSFTASRSIALPLEAAPVASRQIVLVLLTSANFSDSHGNADWKPKEFHQWNGSWHATINGVNLRIVSAILGKAVREGGWDMANNCPRPLQSLIPAGSCYFCEVEGDASDAVNTLHHQKIGNEKELGRGEIVVGVWS